MKEGDDLTADDISSLIGKVWEHSSEFSQQPTVGETVRALVERAMQDHQSVLEEKLRQMSDAMSRNKEAACMVGLSIACGKELTIAEAVDLKVSGRLSMETHAGKELYLLDGVPYIEFFPVEFDTSDDPLVITAKRNYRILR